MAHFNTLYYEESPKKAYEYSKQFTKQKKNALLWDMQNGLSALYARDYKASLEILDKAENRFDATQNAFLKGASYVGATMVNDNVRVYGGNIYEGVLINYYKAIDYMLLNDSANARVQFNRANERQRRAKEFYYKEVQKAIKEMDSNKQHRINMERSREEASQILNATYSNLDKYRAYQGLINPVVSYLSGLFYALEGDKNKGLGYLNEAFGVSQNPVVANDLLFFQRPTNDTFTWIIIEDGKEPQKSEFKIDVPIFMIDSIYNASLALPRLEDGEAFYQNFSLQKGEKTIPFETLSLMDAVVASEFRKQLPYIVTRAILSATFKLSMQAVANYYLGFLGGLVTSLYAGVSTFADTRNTSIFAHKFYVMRLKNKAFENYSVKADLTNAFSFFLQPCEKPLNTEEPPFEFVRTKQIFCSNRHNILYVRSFKNGFIMKHLK
ncbi:hypothetical protein HCD_00175 [Helicobacter cetorum MIT 99-5656]|uniref:Uncharacterized protein n=1 Tax=Helicobacter cetorum (strain ATCC BAA-540 / CCUG 52418 / MIT 99-5656) TaxID=1163745 RepID=I0EQ48_HELCM|nr:hypothetical protein HCD_00175 [Helicobacter cetorum MIT 99-5656]